MWCYYFVSYRCTGTRLDVSWEDEFRGLEIDSVKTSGSSLQLSASNKRFSRERSWPSWLAHEHEQLTACRWKDREVLAFWLRWTRGQWFCFLFCVKRYVPSVHRCREGFVWGAPFVVKTIKDSITTTQVAQELNTQGGWKEWSRHNKTTKTKSNGTLLIQLQHSPYSFFLKPLLSGCKLFRDFFSSFLKTYTNTKAVFCI